MGRAVAIALLVGGCYQPATSPGAPCPDGVCPAGQHCVAGTCRAEGDPGPGPGPGPDDAPPVLPDTAVPDAASIDAPPGTLGPWSAPILIPGVNSAADESDPSLTPDRLTIAFTSERTGSLGAEDIYLGTRASVTEPFTVIAIPEINSTSRDRSPEISADGNTIYFTSSRSGGTDVYVTVRSGGSWSTPQRVAELSSSSSDGDVAISPDGLTALVESANDIHLATRASTGASFGPLTEVAVLNVTGDVAAPSLTNNAGSVYLHGGTTRDLYVAYRQGTAFTTPTPITELNTGDRDAAPFVSGSGKYLAFEREGELYETTR